MERQWLHMWNPRVTKITSWKVCSPCCRVLCIIGWIDWCPGKHRWANRLQAKRPQLPLRHPGLRGLISSRFSQGCKNWRCRRVNTLEETWADTNLYQRLTRSKTDVISLTAFLYHQVLVVQKLDSAIHRINHYPMDKYYENWLRYPLDSNLSSG